jgi:hypothetical protein
MLPTEGLFNVTGVSNDGLCLVGFTISMVGSNLR